MASAAGAQIKRYIVPVVLLFIGLFFQLVILPNSYPRSHYDVLGLRPGASIEDVAEAYEKLSADWYSDSGTPTTIELVKVRYAFELLTNPLWKRDYDLFGIDEQQHLIKKVKEQHDGVKFSDIELPLLEASPSDKIQTLNAVIPENFISAIGGSRPMLIQVYSDGSPRCAEFINIWEQIANALDEVADTGMIEISDGKLASYLAEKKSTQQPFFRHGLPALVAFPPNCRSSSCYLRYQGDHTMDSVVDWVATDILGLPRILYYTKETLVSKFFAGSAPHKVKVIFFSKTGERATPFVRQAAKDYWTYASFAMVLWRDEDSSLWWNTFNVESAPAVVILKDPGVQPVVHHGGLNSSYFLNFMENNKNQELPQLRSATSMELGCDANGYSRAGYSTHTWYCVILAGRRGLELNKMRDNMRKVQKTLAVEMDMDNAKSTPAPGPTACLALKEKRLTFAWLDGEAQKKYCLFYLSSENAQETCGPAGYSPIDVPRLFIVRYKRNSTENEIRANKKVKNIWNMHEEENPNTASQLVARYSGSDDIQEIIQWISKIVKDGDTTELPYFVDNTPELVPEDSSRPWTSGSRGVLSAGKGLKHRIQSIISLLNNYIRDPRVGPIFLLAACLSFGTIWLQSSQPTQPAQKDDDTSSEKTEKSGRAKRHKAANHDRKPPPSITDEIPKDAYQMLPSDSDSE